MCERKSHGLIVATAPCKLPVGPKEVNGIRITWINQNDEDGDGDDDDDHDNSNNEKRERENF